MENLELKELFRRTTGIVTDVNKIIENAQNKNAVFRHIVWHMPRGLKYQNGTAMQQEVAECVKQFAEALGVDPEVALTEDGVLSKRDKDFLSQIEIEVKDPDTTDPKPDEGGTGTQPGEGTGEGDENPPVVTSPKAKIWYGTTNDLGALTTADLHEVPEDGCLLENWTIDEQFFFVAVENGTDLSQFDIKFQEVIGDEQDWVETKVDPDYTENIPISEVTYTIYYQDGKFTFKKFSVAYK